MNPLYSNLFVESAHLTTPLTCSQWLLPQKSTVPSYSWFVRFQHWKDWYWSWNSKTLATSWEELTHWKRPWCWEGLGAGGEGDNRGWDGWTASPTRWAWVWVNSRSWWWTGRPGVLWFIGSQRVRHDWETELNWTDVWFMLRCDRKQKISVKQLSFNKK